jgi:ribonuclease HII
MLQEITELPGQVSPENIEQKVLNQKTQSKLCGIDEAGRGPVIGPMFIGLVMFHTQSAMESLILKDSKKYGSGKRARAFRSNAMDEIYKVATCKLIEIPSFVIDRYLFSGLGLNRLEQDGAKHLISSIPQSVEIMADGITLFSPLRKLFPNLSTENKADTNYPAVAAASIVAKHFRDDWIERYSSRIEKTTGLIVSGGGYPNLKTKEFIHNYTELTGKQPPYIRKSWKISKPKTLPLFKT